MELRIQIATLLLLLFWPSSLFFTVESKCSGSCNLALASYFLDNGTTLSNINLNLNSPEAPYDQINFEPILRYNPSITNKDLIQMGTRLLVPFPCECQPGDFLAHVFRYSVQPEDTYDIVATEHYANLTTEESLRRTNSFPATNIPPSATLNVSVNCFCGNESVSKDYGLFVTYPLRPEDSLDAIASSSGVPAETLQRYNPGVDFRSGSGIVFVPGKDPNGTFPPFKSSDKGGLGAGVIAGICIGVLVALLLISFVIYYVYRKNKKQESHSSSIPLSAKVDQASLQSGDLVGTGVAPGLAAISVDKSVEFTLEELAKATDNFNLSFKIGQGGFGAVYYAELRGEKAAIKKMDMEASKQFLAELKVLTRVHHVNLVRLIGYCVEGSLFLIYEYVENGNLGQHLHGSGREPLPWTKRVHIALDSARGLDATDGGSASGESSKPSAKLLTAGDRRLLKVELRQGETTYVSWKKLMKEASKGNCSLVSVIDAPPPNANPNLESRIAPGQQPVEGETVDQPHSNRFNAVIEKIERLYMGRDSSDGEELDGAPDDDEYDTEDSFIDDVELDEYFEVDDSAIKHDGFFVNKGELERIAPSTTTTSNKQPKKRKRKESAKPCGDVVDVSSKQAKIAKTVGGKDQSAASGLCPKKKSNDTKTVQDSVSPLKVQSGNDSLSLENVKHSDKANPQPRNTTSPKSKAAGSSGALHLKCSKSAHQQSNSVPGKSRPIVLEKSTVARQKENNGMHDQDNATVSRQSNQITKKGGSNVKPKTSTLEKAFRELEKVVAESRPPTATDNQDADTSSQVVKRRLPGDVKLKLAKVARIAQASQGNLSGELINRLMSIVGHLIQVRSLKRNLKIMIDSGDSAKRENDTRFQSIKNEVIETLKTQVPLMEPQATNQEAGTSDDFENPPPSTKKKFVMDEALEDKLCDLYDIFVDGLDEDSGPQIRKLYANLAELWPNRLMDNHGIKRAICRAKERRRALHANLGKEMDQGKMKKKQTQLVQKSESTACPDKASGVGDKTTGVVPSASTTSLVQTQPTVDKSRDKSKQKHEKLKGSSSSSDPSGEAKATKRKKEKSAEESHIPTVKQQIRPQAPLDLNLPS